MTSRYAAKFFDIPRFVTETRENREVNVRGQSRLTPPL